MTIDTIVKDAHCSDEANNLHYQAKGYCLVEDKQCPYHYLGKNNNYMCSLYVEPVEQTYTHTKHKKSKRKRR